MGDEKWNTVLINPGTVEVLDENKKTVLKAKTKERALKKQESTIFYFITLKIAISFIVGDVDPKIIPKEKTKMYDPTKAKANKKLIIQ